MTRGTMLGTEEKVLHTEERLNDLVPTGTRQVEDSSIIVEEIMIAQVTHQNDEGGASHNLPLQIIREDDSLLVLIRAELNSQGKAVGTAT